MLIGIIATALMPQGSWIASFTLLGTFILEIVWILFLLRRWRLKADEFVPARRFSDDPAGYN